MNLFFLEVRYNNGREPQELVGVDCHAVKSIAGTMFYYAENVAQVTVTTRSGLTVLNLEHDFPECTVNLPSDFVAKVLANSSTIR